MATLCRLPPEIETKSVIEPVVYRVRAVYVSFFWGVVVFGEPVRSMSACIVALLLMTVGMAGASSNPVSSDSVTSAGYIG